LKTITARLGCVKGLYKLSEAKRKIYSREEVLPLLRHRKEKEDRQARGLVGRRRRGNKTEVDSSARWA
jgi:hypothetical protein